MKFGLYGLHKGSSVESDTLARRARLAEAAGFESLWVGDHIALPAAAPMLPTSRGWNSLQFSRTSQHSRVGSGWLLASRFFRRVSRCSWPSSSRRSMFFRMDG